MKANSLKIAFEQCMLSLVVVVFQAACFAGDASQAAPAAKAQREQPVYDVVVYGDSSGAVIAAVAAKREGRSVILVNPSGFPGGMSSSGLGATDFLGKRNTLGGIASEFYDGKRIAAIATLGGKTYRGNTFIDATYVGDLMAAAGVTYTVGREPESQYGEDMAGVRRGIGSLEAPGRTGRQIQLATDSIELERAFFLDVADASGGERY